MGGTVLLPSIDIIEDLTEELLDHCFENIILVEHLQMLSENICETDFCNSVALVLAPSCVPCSWPTLPVPLPMSDSILAIRGREVGYPAG